MIPYKLYKLDSCFIYIAKSQRRESLPSSKYLRQQRHLSSISLTVYIILHICLYFFVLFSLHLQAANFFLKYGYIEKKSNESRPTLHIEKAIMDLQKFGGLPVTGKLDQATLELIGTKRCGVKDPVKKVGAIQNQVGEFYLQGTFWKKTVLFSPVKFR